MRDSGRNFLITGATGFLGGAAAVAALRAGYGPHLRLLARQCSEGAAADRLLANLRKLGASNEEIESLGHDFLLEADLARPESLLHHPLLADIERVIHAAALPTFTNHPAIPTVNVNGTLALARSLDPARIERFVFVGTAMAVGPSLQRGSVVQETSQLGSADDHLVPYTASKAEAERRLRTEFPWLPLIVARPSIVVGHTQLGVAPSQSIFWVFLVGHMLGAFTCELTDSIDVVPADWCAKALLYLATNMTLEHDLYHISAGQRSSITIEAFDEAMSLARSVAPIGDNYRRIGSADIGKLMPKMRELVPGASRRLLLRALQLYGGFAELNYVFDNTRLLQEGLPAPPPFTSYLSRCVESARGIAIADQMKWDFK